MVRGLHIEDALIQVRVHERCCDLVFSLVLQLLIQVRVHERCYLVLQPWLLLLLPPPSHAGAGAAAASRLVSLPPDCKQRECRPAAAPAERLDSF